MIQHVSGMLYQSKVKTVDEGNSFGQWAVTRTNVR
jgi:hypothetical protein